MLITFYNPFQKNQAGVLIIPVIKHQLTGHTIFIDKIDGNHF